MPHLTGGKSVSRAMDSNRRCDGILPAAQLSNVWSSQSSALALKSSRAKTGADYFLLFAAHMRSLSGVQQALRDGANVNATQECRTPIIIATEKNARQLVEFLADVEDVDLDCQNIFGNTPLMIALGHGFDEVRPRSDREFRSRSPTSPALPDSNSADKERRWSGRRQQPREDAPTRSSPASTISARPAANTAPPHGKLDNVQGIRTSERDRSTSATKRSRQFESSDCFGERPIYTCSVKKPNLPLLNILLDAGASSEYENETGLSLLSRAILNEDNFRIVKRLVLDGADVNHQDRFCKRTPLHMAAMINSSRTVKVQ